MNIHLQRIYDLIKQSASLSAEDIATLEKALKDTDKELEILSFKLDRTEKVKHTTAILLEETIEELEQKRKAVEVQNRELEIESSLERVRTVAMSMNKPDDMLEVCTTISLQLQSLGVKDIRNVQTAIFHEERGTYMNYEYYAKHNKTFITEVFYTDHEIGKAFAASMLKGKGEISFTLIKGEEKVKEWLAYQKTTNVFIDTFLETASSLSYYWFSLGPVALGISTYVALSDDELILFKRFLNVFELAYRRFLDIEQAEAQAREAQIEAALERVRAVAMSMRASEDLLNVCEVMFHELGSLGFNNIRNAIIDIYDDEKKRKLNYDYSDVMGKTMSLVPYDIHPFIEKQIKEIRSADDAFSETVFAGQELGGWKEFRRKSGQKDDPRVTGSSTLHYYFFSISKGAIGISTFGNIDAIKLELLKRFRNVFSLSYQRYMDIVLAEEQAREAQIEASLERVRSRAMAMHKSDDLHLAVATVFEELDKLNPGILRCGIAIIDKTKPRSDIWITVKSEQGNTVQVSGDEPLDIHPLLQGAYDGWLKQEDFYYVLQDKDLEDYYEAIAKTNFQSAISTTFSPEEKDQHQYYFNAVFQDGSLFAFMETEMTDEVKKLIKRFANVFNLTYKRFLDLQKAEAQAREAQIEASLERVRANAMAMHNSADLSSTVNIFFKELKTLGITPMRCGIGEMLEGTHTSELVFTTADKQGELYELPGKLLHEGHPVIENIYKYWEHQEEYHPVLHGTDMIEYYKVIKSQMILPEFPEYTRHFGNYFYFKEGFFFAWAEKEFTGEAMNIFRKFTSVLSLTYKRYKDLKQAEAQAEQARLDLIQIQTEKKRAEDALTELKATQAQLIQSEKMASLGELTAGIAHEIQNPLNFVNNFSEVNTELIEEMKQEIAKENFEEIIAIANDIKDNQEKITHHGKRADAIVKGMLQHSRTSSGVKEPTDINALADEYLRLAYHGLRAKDKSFNAKMITNFDESIGLVNVIPQEIGRVILNLITNAFYAVTEKKNSESTFTPQPPKGGLIYEPRVIVSTKRIKSPLGDLGVEISVRDNGAGISQKVLDKIFQPFFTTKPTGQGTGLGLSLSYDIVKAHGGDLTVKTKEGEGTEFVLLLPLLQSEKITV